MIARIMTTTGTATAGAMISALLEEGLGLDVCDEFEELAEVVRGPMLVEVDAGEPSELVRGPTLVEVDAGEPSELVIMRVMVTRLVAGDVVDEGLELSVVGDAAEEVDAGVEGSDSEDEDEVKADEGEDGGACEADDGGVFEVVDDFAGASVGVDMLLMNAIEAPSGKEKSDAPVSQQAREGSVTSGRFASQQ